MSHVSEIHGHDNVRHQLELHLKRKPFENIPNVWDELNKNLNLEK